MTATIVGKSLTNVDLASDGSRVRLNLTDAEDRAATLELPLECVNQMIMTLPNVFERALRARYRDSSIRLVFPLGDWRLEQGAGDGRLILTLATEDGFQIAFAVDVTELERMRKTVASADEPSPSLLN